MRAFRMIAQIPLEILQGVLMGLSVGLGAAGRVLDRAGRVALRHLYYPVCRARRLVAGEPSWKPMDATIGIKAPPEYPRCRHGVPQGIECFWCESGQEPMEIVVSAVPDDEPPRAA